MASEIERKFLVPELPDPEALGPGDRMAQGYLAVDGPVEVRLRVTHRAAVLTVKAGAGLARTEVEVLVDPADVDPLWACTAGRRIEKVRHRCLLPTGELADVDVYGGSLDGLSVAEVEFPDVGTASAFQPPAWFGRELTGEPGWSTASLAARGRPS